MNNINKEYICDIDFFDDFNEFNDGFHVRNMELNANMVTIKFII